MTRRLIRTALIGLVMLLVIGAAVPGLAARLTRPAPRIDLLAFGSPTGLWTVWGDGSHLRQLLADPWAFDPAWSPNGRLLAYMHRDPDNGNYSLWVLGLKPLTVWPITDGSVQYSSPSWSPDGHTLYAGESGRIVAFEVSDLANPGAAQVLLDPPVGANAWSPRCGPTGLIAYVHAEGGTSIRTLDPDTGDTQLVIGDLTHTILLDPGNPSWSPDGESIAFLNNLRPAGANSLNIASVDGDLPNLGTPVAWFWDRGVRAGWSQVGPWVYFYMRDPYIEGIEELYRVGTDGTGQVRIVTADQVGGAIGNPTVTRR